MNKDIIRMTKVELERLKILHRVIEKELTQVKAAEILGISERQAQRIIKGIKEKGDRGIIHGNRGKPSPQKVSAKRERSIGGLVAKRYADFGPTLASEKLWEREGIRISREKLRQIMIEKGLWRVRRKKGKNMHVWRERKAYYGEMVQMDGSSHDWLEGRGPKIVLMGYVDDATGWTFGRFYEYEGVYPAMDSLERYSRKYGLPVSLYMDKHSTYKTTREANLEEELRGEQAQTQFERAAKELGIKTIHANSPQAKGRIERVFGTLQDRLIKEMRLEGIATMEEANQFLERYLPIYNKRFARESLREADLHRPLPKGLNVQDIFCIKDTRRINEGYTLKWKGRLFVIENPSIVMRKRKAVVMEHFDGKMTVTFNGKELKLREITCQQLQERKSDQEITFKPRKKSSIPAADHPWSIYPAKGHF